MRTSGVFARSYDGLDTAVEVGFAGGRVIAISFPPTVPDDADADHALLDRIGTYLRGEPDDFSDVSVALTVPSDQRPVLEALRDVGYGTAISVSHLTRRAGLDDSDPADLEIVTRALRTNPIPIVFPDHRVDGGPYATPSGVRDVVCRIESI